MFRASLRSRQDGDLLARYAKGDRAAATELSRRLLPALMRLGVRMLDDVSEAEDVVQETMLRLWRIAPDWQDGQAQVSTWVYRVAMNLCTDRLRKRRHLSGMSIDDAPEPMDEAPGAEVRLQDNARQQALQGALAALPDRQRQAVVLRHLEGMSNPEIAAIMDIGVEAVESLTARGRRSLKQALEGRRAELGFEHG